MNEVSFLRCEHDMVVVIGRRLYTDRQRYIYRSVQAPFGSSLQYFLLLPLSDIPVVQVCTNSCFGQSSLSRGIRVFSCTGMESRLIDCGHTNTNNAECQEDAGIVCCKYTPPGLQLIHYIFPCM